MARRTKATTDAEVSISHETHTMYVGIKAREDLDVGYNDPVAIITETPDGEEIREFGFLTSASQIHVGIDTVRKFGDPDEGATTRVEAIVESLSGAWEDNKNRLARRWDSVPTLENKE